MPGLYIFSVWLHILAATVWVGGMLFLVLVVVPWLRAGPRPDAGAFLSQTGRRFRTVGWVCFGVLMATGLFNLWVRGVRPSDFVRPEWLQSSFGRTVLFKLIAFGVVLAVSTLHDFVVGPRATAVMGSNPGSAEATALRRRASQLGRINVLLALALIAAGVVLVRGVPW